MPLIPEDIINQIREKCDIVETISTYISLKKAGRNFKACCPFHPEKTPSFVVNPEKQIFHCFGCGIGGDVVSFVMRHERLEFVEAVRMLAQQVSVVIPESSPRTESSEQRQEIFEINEMAVECFHNNLLKGVDAASHVARDYLKSRGVKLETVEKFRLGFALDQWDGLMNYLRQKKVTLAAMERAGLIIAREGKEGYYDRFRNRIIFPILDTRSHCRAFGARTMETSSAKYINSPETNIYTKGHHLYGVNLARPAISSDDCVIIVEGYMDSMIPFQEGVMNIVASLGTALTVEQIRLLRRYTSNVVFLYDMDAAGQEAMVRSLDMLVEEGMNVHVGALEPGEDPDSFVRKFGIADFRSRITNAPSLFDFKLNYLRRRYRESTPEGKARISSEMLVTIGKFTNLVTQSDYVRRLSRELTIPEDVLAKEWQKTNADGVRQHLKKTDERVHLAQQQQQTLEHHILKLLLEGSEFISATKQHMAPSDFQDQSVRMIIEKIYGMHERGEKVDVGRLINSFQDDHTQQVISRLTAGEDIPSSDKNKAHADYMKMFKSRQTKSRQQDLITQMQKAEQAGDFLELETLMREFNQLIKQ